MGIVLIPNHRGINICCGLVVLISDVLLWGLSVFYNSVALGRNLTTSKQHLHPLILLCFEEVDMCNCNYFGFLPKQRACFHSAAPLHSFVGAVHFQVEGAPTFPFSFRRREEAPKGHLIPHPRFINKLLSFCCSSQARIY